LILDRLLQPLLPPTIQPLPAGVALWKRLLAAFYGGITEELLLRLFLMTLIAWGIWRTAYKAQLPPDATVFRAAIVAAAVLFGVAHLPAAALFWPLTPVVVARIIALNTLGGLPSASSTGSGDWNTACLPISAPTLCCTQLVAADKSPRRQRADRHGLQTDRVWSPQRASCSGTLGCARFRSRVSH